MPFAPVEIQAEAPGNLFAGADPVDCTTCDGDPMAVAFKARLPAGSFGIRFYNDESGGAPDIDKVTIS